MGVVDAVDAPPVGVMKGKPIFNSVWTSSGRSHPSGFEFHGVTFREREFVAVEAQERFEFVIRPTPHPISPPKPPHHIMMGCNCKVLALSDSL